MKQTSIDKATLRLFWETTLQRRKTFYMALLFPIGMVFLNSVAPYFIGKIIATLGNPQADHLYYLPHLLGAAAIGIICNRIGATFMFRQQIYGMQYLQELAVTTLLKRSVGFHTNNIGGKLVSDVNDYAQAYGNIANAFFSNLVPFAITLISGSILVFVESWQLGLIVAASAVFAYGIGIYDSHTRMKLRMERLRVGKRLTGHVADTILNVHTVKTFAREADELARNQQYSQALADLRNNDWTWAAKRGNNRMMVLIAMQLGFILTLIQQVQAHPELLGVGIYAFSFTTIIFIRLFDSFTHVRQIEEALLQAHPMTKTILETPEIIDAPNATKLAVPSGEIAFDSVAFTYTDESKQRAVFKELSFVVKPGERVGLVGPSGGGKSTLTRLLLRFDDIQSGVIAIDSQDITAVTQSSLRQAVSYVPQEPLLFHRTVRENIAYGRPDATDEEVIGAAKKAHAHDFITDLSEGYNTIVGERGVKLSGGQRQRVAIARAILKDAPILVLDEATSALDSESEQAIQKALWQLMKGRTAVVVAHRLSTIQKMDRIIVLDEGTIVEEGTHDELVKRKGLYARLWSHQSGGFIDGES